MDENPQAMMEMPRYQCHKIVRALKIKEVVTGKMPAFSGPTCRGSFALGTACGNCERCTWEREHGPKFPTVLVFEDPRYAPLMVTDAYVQKHNPQAGGYYVQYEDGYTPWSPTKAFEEGYTRIN